MKKNITLIQSLLILSLVTPSTSFSMPSTKKKPSQKKALRKQRTSSLKNSTEQLRQTNTESSPAETAINSIISQLPTEIVITPRVTTDLQADPIDNIIEAIIVQELPSLPETPYTAKTLFHDVLTELMEKPITLKTPIIDAPQAAPVELWMEKHTQFQNMLTELQKKPITLKTPSKIEVQDVQAEADINYQKHQNVLNQIIKPITLKPISFTASDLSKSIIPTEMPKEKGLSGWMYRRSFIVSAHELIFEALQTPDFKSNNETHLKMLDDAFNFYVDNNNRDRVIKTLELCQYLEGQIELNELTARKIHNFLENITAEKEKSAEATLAQKRDLFMTQRNTMIIALQEDLARRTKELNDQLNNYEQACTDAFTVEADQIRTLKISTAIIHALNPRLLLGKQESCSDRIDCLSTKHIKKYMNPSDIDAVHSNEKILKRIKADEKMTSLKENTLDLYSQIAFVNRSAQEIKIKQDRPALPNPLLQSSSTK